MPLVPGIALSLLSSSISRNDSNGGTQTTGAKMTITDETALAVGTLKQLLSMLSLAIQALYGSRKGGLLSAKASNRGGGNVQLNRAKKIFVSGAKEYVPIMLRVVSMLDEPIQLSRHLAGRSKRKKEETGSAAVQTGSDGESKTEEPRARSDASAVNSPLEPIQRKRTDSMDKDWVDVHPLLPSQEINSHRIQH